MRRSHALLTISLCLAACSPPREPIPITPPGDAAGAAVVRRTLPEPAPSPPQVASISPTAPIATLGAPAVLQIVVPANALYVCVAETPGQRQQTTIEFSPKVGELCRKHPEMGPCQYERDICRRSGGRVFAANGVEITKDTEVEYDKKVLRVRFRAN